MKGMVLDLNNLIVRFNGETVKDNLTLEGIEDVADLKIKVSHDGEKFIIDLTKKGLGRGKGVNPDTIANLVHKYEDYVWKLNKAKKTDNAKTAKAIKTATYGILKTKNDLFKKTKDAKWKLTAEEEKTYNKEKTAKIDKNSFIKGRIAGKKTSKKA
jgi:hypothetical protein